MKPYKLLLTVGILSGIALGSANAQDLLGVAVQWADQGDVHRQPSERHAQT